MTASGPPLATTVWGADDAAPTWRDTLAVEAWDACEPDDFIRVHPRLMPPAAPVPDRLLRHLSEGLAVRAWRLSGHGDRMLTLRALGSAEVEAMGRSCEADWFARRGPVLSLFATRPDRARERAALGFLDEVLLRLREGRAGDHDEATAVRFAFHAGIHPAYLWPAALIAHERNLAAGWLGMLARGRPALMPDEVADTLAEALEDDGGCVSVRDPALAVLAGEALDWDRLRRAALACRRGGRILVRPGRSIRDVISSRRGLLPDRLVAPHRAVGH